MSSSTARGLAEPTVVWIGIIFILIAVVAGGCLSLAYHYEKNERQRILPGIQILNVPVGGLTPAQAQITLEHAVHDAARTGMQLSLAGKILSFPIRTAISDSNQALIHYDIPGSIQQAYAYGHRGSIWQNTYAWLRLRHQQIHLPIVVSVDHDAIQETIQTAFQRENSSPRSAQLQISLADAHSAPIIDIQPEHTGQTMDPASVLPQLDRQAANLSFSPIDIPLSIQQPAFTSRDVEQAVQDLPTWLRHPNVTLTAQDQTWKISSKLVATWLNVAPTSTGLILVLDPDRAAPSLSQLAKNILHPAQDGYLEVSEGTTTQPTTLLTTSSTQANATTTKTAPPKLVLRKFIPPIEGLTVDATGTLTAIQTAWAQGSSTAALMLNHEVPVILGSAAEILGIREVLGVGYSNYTGSPVNRKKNMALGAGKVQGSLIPPDSVFSLLKRLGKVTEANGWLPELVIKDNKTTPEAGGGLCQIGTTTFRAALASGLPIVERQNHSYRVPYYEPAGTDATIYEPAPDFKFKNDTVNWILITTQNKNDHLAFTFWGTKDGRIAEQTKPIISHLVPPPDKKIVETLDLPVGKTKCTERAHTGADAKFDYTVTYPNGDSKKTTFRSHYKPWGAVCLIGVVKLSPAAADAEKIDQTGINNPN